MIQDVNILYSFLIYFILQSFVSTHIYLQMFFKPKAFSIRNIGIFILNTYLDTGINMYSSTGKWRHISYSNLTTPH